MLPGLDLLGGRWRWALELGVGVGLGLVAALALERGRVQAEGSAVALAHVQRDVLRRKALLTRIKIRPMKFRLRWIRTVPMSPTQMVPQQREKRLGPLMCKMCDRWLKRKLPKRFARH